MAPVRYQAEDFNACVLYVEDLDIFYVFPVAVFIGYGSEIHPVEVDKRQRRPAAAVYREAWRPIAAGGGEE